MENEKNNGYFPALTGIRAIAAYMVYMYHFNPFSKTLWGGHIHDFVNELNIGVTLFFVLSGFLIAYRYSNLTNFSFRNYMANRLARIYPMYFILTTITFLAYAVVKDKHHMHDLVVYLLNISFLKGFSEWFSFSGISQGWSLTAEETFYMLAPIFFVLIKRSKINLILLPLLSMATGLVLVCFFQHFSFYQFFDSLHFMFQFTFFGRCFEFFIGIALAIFFKAQFFNRKTNYLTYTGMAMIITCVYLISSLKGDYEYGIMHPMGKVINTFILPLFGISVFYLGLLKEKTVISAMLESRIFVLLGKSSYIFYLIHMGLLSKMLQAFISSSLLIFILINFISIVLYKYAEEPLNNYLRKKLRKQNLPVIDQS